MLITLHSVGIVQDLRRGARIRARRKALPTLFVPITRGPIENFYHFFTGYFVPVYWQRMQQPHQHIVVMSVEPFNHWFDLLPGGAPKILPQSKAMKQAFLADSRGYTRDYRVEGVMYWDKWEHFGDKPLSQIAAQMREDLTLQTSGMDSRTPEIVVLGRGHTPDFYTEHSPRPYGATKRNISNLPEIVEVLSRRYSVELLDGAAISPEEMFHKCSHASLILGQHGAGLTNVFFATPGSVMLEIVWPEFLHNAHINIYGPLCDQLGLRWSRPALQADALSPVDPGAVVSEVDKLLGR